MRRIVVLLFPLLLFAGCGSSGPDDARGIAESLAESLDGATVTEVTREDDPLGLFDEDEPPSSVAVIHLPGSDCVLDYAPCGAAVIVHTQDADRLRKVAAYSQAMAVDKGNGVVYQVRDQVELIIDGRQDEFVKAQLVDDFDGESPLSN